MARPTCPRLIIAIVVAVTATATQQHAVTFSPDRLHALVSVRIGTPPQILNLIVDTSTSDLVVFNDSSVCGSHCYDATKSESFIPGSALGIDLSPAIFGLEIDGASINDSSKTTVGADTAGFDDRFNATLAFMMVSNLRIWRGPAPDTFQSFRDADGILGLAYSSLERLPCLNFRDDTCTQFRHLVGLGSGLLSRFSLDLGSPFPALSVGNISEEYKALVEWGSPNPFQKPYIHRFTVYGLGICGADMFASYNYQWEAIIDTGASCLSLPAEFFDMIMSWIPSIQFDSEPAPGLVPANSTSSLPKLSFHLDVNGRLLYLPLEQLLLPESNGSSRLCIYRDISIGSSMASPPMISFGTLAMRAFYAAFDFETVRVGLANRISLNTSTSDLCNAVVQCTGQQKRWTSMNRCLDPDCTGYLVRHFDPVAKSCVMLQQSEIAIYAMVGILFAAELALHAFYWQQCRKIVASVPSF